MKKVRLLSLVMVISLGIGLLSGCGGSDNSTASSQSSQTSSVSSSEFSYPMEEGDPITWWVSLNGNISPNWTSVGDTPYGKGLMERTGVTIEYQHPPTGQEDEQFGLLIADGNYPDLIEWNWQNGYTGGPEKAISDGVILKLNDIIDQYCPNLKAYLQANPDVDKMVKTDAGNYYCFPFIRGDEVLCFWLGILVRDDLLNEWGLEIPTTYDEWYTVLSTAKSNGIDTPLTATMNSIHNSFTFGAGLSAGFYIGDDGTVHYGPAEENYKTYLSTFAQWYSEGLIDPDFGQQADAKITNGSAVVSVGGIGGSMGSWIKAGQETNSDFSLAGCPFPTLEEGQTPEYGYIENRFPGNGVAISTKCDDIERVARMLDWLYSEEGHIYVNFGTEGVSYTVVDGIPTYTDLIMHNPDGWSVGQAMASYCQANLGGPFVQDVEYIYQYYTLDCQKKALETVSACNAKAHKLPPISPTVDESSEFDTIMTEITTYQDESETRFIIGTDSLDNFDTYVATLKDLGIDRALEIYNAALERYNTR